MSAPPEKAALRRHARLVRERAAESAGQKAAAQFADQFFRHVPLRAKSLIAAYAAIGSEADPSLILKQAAAAGHRLALPKVALEGAPLHFIEWKDGDALAPGPYGTREPTGAPLSRAPDIVLVPLLAFDARGHRLGYGGGYYDRTLAMLREAGAKFLAIGLAFAAQEVDALPNDPYDQRLDWIVSEQGARRLSKDGL